MAAIRGVIAAPRFDAVTICPNRMVTSLLPKRYLSIIELETVPIGQPSNTPIKIAMIAGKPADALKKPNIPINKLMRQRNVVLVTPIKSYSFPTNIFPMAITPIDREAILAE